MIQEEPLKSDRVITDKSNYDNLLEIKKNYENEIYKRRVYIQMNDSHYYTKKYNIEIGDEIPEKLNKELNLIKEYLEKLSKECEEKMEYILKTHKNIELNRETTRSTLAVIKHFYEEINNSSWIAKLFIGVKRFEYLKNYDTRKY